MSVIDEAFALPKEGAVLDAIGRIVNAKIKANNGEIDNLTVPEKILIYVVELEREVNNGGFHQYFFNSAGSSAHEALAAFEAIGAVKSADIIYRAILLFPEIPVPKDVMIRRRILENIEDSLWKKWDKLDDEYYLWEDNLEHLLYNYIKKNKDQFG